MAANLEFLGYSAPSQAAKALMDPETTSNEVAYPSAETLSRGQAFNNLPTETVQTMNDLFNNVKASESGWSLYIMIAVIVVVAVIGVAAYLRKKKRNDY